MGTACSKSFLQKKDVIERSSIDITPLKQSNVPIIFVIGGPGCGKGTQCERIVARFGYTHLSTGDLLRDEVNSGSKRGQAISAVMKKGDLVPLDVVLDLLKEAMMKHLPTSKGYLIDGYPREVKQGVEFETQIKPCSIVLFFDVSDKTMVDRCMKRGQTSGRVDDNEETIKKRLATFHNISRPVVDHYKTKVKTINGELEPDEVFVRLCPFLEALATSKKSLPAVDRYIPPNLVRPSIITVPRMSTTQFLKDDPYGLLNSSASRILVPKSESNVSLATHSRHVSRMEQHDKSVGTFPENVSESDVVSVKEKKSIMAKRSSLTILEHQLGETE